MGVLSLSGYLGGHLSYVLGVGVDHTAFEPRIEEWTRAADSADIAEGGHTVAQVAGNDVLLVREGGQLRASTTTARMPAGLSSRASSRAAASPARCTGASST